MLHNTGYSLASGMTVGFIDLNKNVEEISEYMTAAHARVNTLNVFRFDISILFSEFFELSLDLRLLLCLIKIVFPLFFVDAVNSPSPVASIVTAPSGF